MGIEQVCRCDKCNKVLEKGEKGFAILGNIHSIDSQKEDCVGGGFIGNNLDDKYVVLISYFCSDCLLKVLYLDKDFQRVSKRDMSIKGAHL